MLKYPFIVPLAVWQVVLNHKLFCNVSGGFCSTQSSTSLVYKRETSVCNIFDYYSTKNKTAGKYKRITVNVELILFVVIFFCNSTAQTVVSTMTVNFMHILIHHGFHGNS